MTGLITPTRRARSLGWGKCALELSHVVQVDVGVGVAAAGPGVVFRAALDPRAIVGETFMK